MPDDPGQLFAHHRAGHMLAASPGNFLIKLLHYRIVPIGDNSRLIEGYPQVPVAIFIFTAMAMFAARILTSRYQPAIADKLLRRGKPGDITDLGDHRPGADQPEPRKHLESLHVPVKIGLSFDSLFHSYDVILSHTDLIQK